MTITRSLILGSAAALAVFVLAIPSRSEAAPNAPAATPAPAPAGNCKAYGGGKCCSPDVTLHLSKDAVYAACGKTEATYLGEVGSKDTCKYVFKIAGENEDSTYVQVYSPIAKEVLEKPTDPFMSFKKVGKVWVTDKAKSQRPRRRLPAAQACIWRAADTSSAWRPPPRFAPSPRPSSSPRLSSRFSLLT